MSNDSSAPPCIKKIDENLMASVRLFYAANFLHLKKKRKVLVHIFDIDQ